MTDIALMIVDLDKFPKGIFTEMFQNAGHYCTRPTEEQVKQIKAIFGDDDNDDN